MSNNNALYIIPPIKKHQLRENADIKPNKRIIRNIGNPLNLFLGSIVWEALNSDIQKIFLLEIYHTFSVTILLLIHFHVIILAYSAIFI